VNDARGAPVGMTTLPVKEQFRPTLPELLTPRWRESPVWVRAAWRALALAVVLIAAAIAIFYPRDPWITHSASPSFSLQYPPLMHRVTPLPGDYARVVQQSGGELIQSVDVGPLDLGAFTGDVSAQFPVYAAAYVARLSRTLRGFLEQSEGKTRVGNTPGYWISYQAQLEGSLIYGRVIFLVPTPSGSGVGVTIAMLQRPASDVQTPDQVAVNGDLYEPLHTFTFG
jgi:hypothetical protein